MKALLVGSIGTALLAGLIAFLGWLLLAPTVVRTDYPSPWGGFIATVSCSTPKLMVGRETASVRLSPVDSRQDESETVFATEWVRPIVHWQDSHTLRIIFVPTLSGGHKVPIHRQTDRYKEVSIVYETL